MLNRESVVYFLFSLMSICLGIATTYFLSINYSVPDFGRIQFLLALVASLSIVKLFGFDIVIQKEIYNGNDRAVKDIYKFALPLSTVLLIVSASVYLLYFNESYEKDLIFVVFSTFFIVLDRSSAILNAKLKFKTTRYLELLTRFSIFIFTVICVLYSYDVDMYLFGYCIIFLFVTIIRLFISLRTLDFNMHPVSLKERKAYIRDGFINSASSSLLILANWIEKLILGYLDVSSLAIFTIGQLIPKVIKDNCKLLLIPSINLWASKGIDYAKNAINSNKVTLFTLGITCVLSIYVFTSFFIDIFFPEYDGSVEIAYLLSLSLIVKFSESAKMSVMALSQHTNKFNYINNVISIVKIFFACSFIPNFGINGALATVLLSDAMRYYLVCKEFNKL